MSQNNIFVISLDSIDKIGLLLTRSDDHRSIGLFFGVANDWPRQRLNARIDVKNFPPTFEALLGMAAPTSDSQVIQALCLDTAAAQKPKMAGLRT
jgi:hypothetical protein